MTLQKRLQKLRIAYQALKGARAHPDEFSTELTAIRATYQRDTGLPVQSADAALASATNDVSALLAGARLALDYAAVSRSGLTQKEADALIERLSDLLQ